MFLAFSTHRRHFSLSIDLLELFTRAHFLLVVLVSTRMKKILERFWHIQARQCIYQDNVKDDTLLEKNIMTHLG
jgi:hypothetical protein